MLKSLEYQKDIGFIAGDVPFPLSYDESYPLIAVPIGRSFHIYSAEDLKLKYVSSRHNGPIRSICFDGECAFTATDTILRYTNYKDNEYDEISITSPITELINLGKGICAAIQGKNVIGYQVTYREIDDDNEETDFSILFTLKINSEITTIFHPNTYINKLFICLSNGSIQLWNFRSNSLIHTFTSFGSPVHLIRQSASVDIFAVALYDGRVVLFNAKTSDTLFSLQHPSQISDVSFRVDGPPQLAVSLMTGAIYLWDLSLRQIIATFPNAHSDSITSLHFLLKRPLLLTGGCDNAIRQWILDENTKDVFRLQRVRIGHEHPPTAISFANESTLITGSSFSTLIAMNPAVETSAQLLSVSPLSPRHLTHPLSSISATPSSRFCTLATVHSGGSAVLLWDATSTKAGFARRALTAAAHNGPRLEGSQSIPFAELNGPVTACCSFLTRCGNFGVVGGSDGSVQCFALQSARWLGEASRRHESPLVFVNVDPLNTVISSGATDGSIFFHSFNERSFDGSLSLPSPLISAEPHPNGTLMAVLTGKAVFVIDTHARIISREFDFACGEGARAAFSSTGRFLFVADPEQKRIALFDIIAAELVEQMTLKEEEIVGIACMPHSNVVATIHKGSVAIRLWQFRPERIEAPVAAIGISEKHTGLAVLSDQPVNKIKDIVNPPEDPLRYARQKAQVPFFLSAAIEKLKRGKKEDAVQSNESEENKVVMITEFTQKLRENNVEAFEVLKKIDAKEIGVEIAALGIDDQGIDERLLFLKMLKEMLQKRVDFEFVQALLNAFLKEFGMKIAEKQELKDELNELRKEQENAIKFMEDDLAYSKCLIQMISKIQ